MAKSKVGGSRAYIRGRIGADVYSIGKDGKGTRQQVVRSLAEQVSNPRTEPQMFGRMVMSTVMQAVSALKPIIDHSFDGFPKGQPCISEFIRQNYALVKADATAHPLSGNQFGLNKYQEKGIKNGRYVVSAGSAVLPSAVTCNGRVMLITLTESTATVGGLKQALGLSADGYLTLVAINPAMGAMFARVKISTTLADTTAISAENVASLFSIESNAQVSVEFASNIITVGLPESTSQEETEFNGGVIVSEKVDGSWIHNSVVLNGGEDYSFWANAALPTYPQGSQMFLNGGDL